jgi:pheromone shutdown protein TraB
LPVVTPVTVIVAAAAPAWVPLRVTPPLDDVHVAVWPEIALPLSEPIVKVTRSEPVAVAVAVVVEPDAALTPVGAAGTVAGTMVFDAAPVPTAFVARTEHV